MPRKCLVCLNKRLTDIDAALVRGEAYRSIAKQYGCSEPAVFRHKNTHLPKKLALAKINRDTLSAENLLQEMNDLKERLRRGLNLAESAGNAGAFVAFGREFRQTLEAYFGISDRMAQREFIRAGTSGGTLGERIAAARRRVAEARELAEDDNSLASLPAASLKPV
jgi:hypothetical protein